MITHRGWAFHRAEQVLHFKAVQHTGNLAKEKKVNLDWTTEDSDSGNADAVYGQVERG